MLKESEFIAKKNVFSNMYFLYINKFIEILMHAHK